MLLKRPLILMSIVLTSLAQGGLIVSHAQEASTDDSTVSQTTDENDAEPLTEEAQKKAQELKQKAEKKRKEEQVSKAKPPKEVFKPTEEISEDSPVPFPVDI